MRFCDTKSEVWYPTKIFNWSRFCDRNGRPYSNLLKGDHILLIHIYVADTIFWSPNPNLTIQDTPLEIHSGIPISTSSDPTASDAAAEEPPKFVSPIPFALSSRDIAKMSKDMEDSYDISEPTSDDEQIKSD